MRSRTTIASALALLPALSVFAADDAYLAALKVYKAEIARDTPELVNADFYSVSAESQARRAMRNASRDADNDLTIVSGDRGPAAGGGNINVASPVINGRVNGNVNIIVQPGALKGRITSVRR